MNIDLSTIARRLQPAAVLVSVGRLLRRSEERRPRRERRRERRSMNG
ncbi:MAG: hypothetical protein JWQ89_99 [Devosia sp.]|nr:hypothetical protein [Devosia sp.]MDB5538372.1 hypothetical protein [Devosia sp.]